MHGSIPSLLAPTLALSLCAACGALQQALGPGGTREPIIPDDPAFELTYVPDLPVSRPPFDEVHASWKQRLDQPYVFFEHFGSYTETGALIPALHRELLAQGLAPAGAPFCLFYDDPGKTAVAELRSRACIPITGPRSPLAPLRYEVLPSTTVAYAFVSGHYPDVPRAYPGVYAFMNRMGWVENGPIREIYLVPPGANPKPDALLCEVQVPATTAR
jgi:DNA gyrase inhibitor GyrI